MKITLQIVPAGTDKITFRPIGETYTTIGAAMKAAKKYAGRDATYWGDGLSIRYAGPNGTVYLCGVKP